MIIHNNGIISAADLWISLQLSIFALPSVPGQIFERVVTQETTEFGA